METKRSPPHGRFNLLRFPGDDCDRFFPCRFNAREYIVFRGKVTGGSYGE
ncbi:hypothetical protein ACN23B_02970 [Anabaena sp. FACHB-709]|uniref:Uncharacterized protein n=1 Tax=Anabaena cylindrica FACHB-318 TaxID=2692880 RepID=A0ABR7ZJ46_ANACY|nr:MULTISPECIES: hypothetical protein [Nostocaceae]MBD2172423.1 hypothetical protein [Anabaena cylindrica FACHB-318]MBD2284436.1 hypothetical protein [Anabaena cylindrica FACHB-170]